jgi:hypothetical protein
MDQDRQISYEALEPGTPVLATGGTPFGTVEHVLADASLDLFDGLAVKTHHHGHRFVDRDQITDIRTGAVSTTVDDDAVDSLRAPNGPLVLHPDTAHDEGPSLSARWGRLFGREHWRELE